jgi:hypothetical protein
LKNQYGLIPILPEHPISAQAARMESISVSDMEDTGRSFQRIIEGLISIVGSTRQ